LYSLGDRRIPPSRKFCPFEILKTYCCDVSIAIHALAKAVVSETVSGSDRIIFHLSFSIYHCPFEDNSDVILR